MAEYCTIAEVSILGIAAGALEGIPAIPDRQDQVQAASSRIDGYLRSRFTLPLVAWQMDIRQACAVIAAYNLLISRGVSPDGDEAFIERYKDTIRWLEGIAAGKVTPSVTDSASGSTVGRPSGGPVVISSTGRGWNVRGTGQQRGRYQSD